jgi:hypothetical protein
LKLSQNEIESVKPALTVILDDGDFIINSTGPIGKAMAQSVFPLLASAKRVTVITDGEMKVMKRNGSGVNAAQANTQPVTTAAQQHAAATVIAKAYAGEPDIQDQFAADLESGRTGEIATGEAPTPTPGPSDPVKIPARRKPQIFQDAAAPPAPELAEAEMDRLLQEAAQAERDAAKVREDQRFQAQQAVQAVQAGDESAPAESEAPARPRKREPRNLDISGRACGNCGGGGQSMRIDSTGSPIMDANGHPMSGVCQVCSGSGQVKAWGRGRGR